LISSSTLIVYAAIGIITGAVVNWAIYRLAWNKREIGPWSPVPESVNQRPALARIPILGWLLLRSESSVHGSGFWIRPVLIECCMGLFFAFFANWKADQLAEITIDGTISHSILVWQTIAHLTLVTLLVAATFVDFDEQTIPDEITVAGVIAGLAFAVAGPGVELWTPQFGEASGTATRLGFIDEADWPESFGSLRGMLIAMAIIGCWGLASMPKLCTLKYGFRRGVQYLIASVIRPRRKSLPKGMPRRRKPFPISTAIAVTSIALWIVIAIVWNSGSFTAQFRLMTSLVGISGAMALVWSVRIVSRYAMGQEAMGFGDVTLIGVIGAFLGWQAAIVTFFLAPLAGVVIGIVQRVVTGKAEMAFGPYLSLGAMVVMMHWPWIWEHHAYKMFSLGWVLPGMIACGVLLMGGILYVMQLMKRR